jgi:hypothetical protein
MWSAHGIYARFKFILAGNQSPVHMTEKVRVVLGRRRGPGIDARRNKT